MSRGRESKDGRGASQKANEKKAARLEGPVWEAKQDSTVPEAHEIPCAGRDASGEVERGIGQRAEGYGSSE